VGTALKIAAGEFVTGVITQDSSKIISAGSVFTAGIITILAGLSDALIKPIYDSIMKLKELNNTTTNNTNINMM